MNSLQHIHEMNAVIECKDVDTHLDENLNGHREHDDGYLEDIEESSGYKRFVGCKYVLVINHHINPKCSK